jgi:hypothetical protein
MGSPNAVESITAPGSLSGGRVNEPSRALNIAAAACQAAPLAIDFLGPGAGRMKLGLAMPPAILSCADQVIE